MFWEEFAAAHNKKILTADKQNITKQILNAGSKESITIEEV